MERSGKSCHVCQVIGDASWILIAIGALAALLSTDPELGKLAAYMLVAGLALQLGSVVSGLLRRFVHSTHV